MRIFLIPLAAAASMVAIAAPASAQWYPQPQTYPQRQAYPYGYQQPQAYPYGYQQPQAYPYGYQQPQAYPYGYQQPQAYGYGYQNPYQQPYGNAYGYQNNYGQAQAMKQRIDRIQRDLTRLAQYRMITRDEYNNLIRNSREIERRFYRNARDGRGLTQREMYEVQMLVARLEQMIARDLRDGRQWRHRW